MATLLVHNLSYLDRRSRRRTSGAQATIRAEALVRTRTRRTFCYSTFDTFDKIQNSARVIGNVQVWPVKVLQVGDMARGYTRVGRVTKGESANYRGRSTSASTTSIGLAKGKEESLLGRLGAISRP